MNKVILIGRITKDPEIKYTPSGNAFMVFALAVDRGYKDETGNTPTDFISCVAWRQQAEFIANYIKKGYLIAISGALQVRSYQAQNGENRIITEVVLDDVKNLTPKPKEEKPLPQEPSYYKNPQTTPNSNSNVKINGQGVDFVKDEDLPF